MSSQRTSQLYDRDKTVNFYQERYSHGYMDEWPAAKKQRVIEVIRSLDLPDSGEAIDFGCGNGVFTQVLKQALPGGWKVYGMDISAVAIENARKRYPHCTFFVAGDREFASKKFDFAFTHHVLEHVYDLPRTIAEINDLLSDDASLLHILPCGNEGSFEHRICMLRKDGVNPKLENRFFFEDEGHLRRINSEQLSKLYIENGGALKTAFYSNQYYGAINWITQSGPGFLRFFTDPSSAKDENARNELIRVRNQLFLFWCLRYPASFVENRLQQRNRTSRDYLFLALGLPLYVFTKPMDLYLKRKATNEWRTRKTDHNGSEMYLFYKR